MGDEWENDLFGFKHRNDPEVSAKHDRDHFDRFMFGGTRNIEEQSEPPAEQPSPLSKYLERIDLDEVMFHVDTLITSAKELKPLLGKVRPIFDHFIEKNKS
ncbi:hypothetical protein [Mesobacillus jeotgali]|uniref:hypothetical protein n=1 Tax=Mesobacillus jeotgali TaxID=129985 RepID=UPI0009A6729E|nr:hypothetical protein [Mesobacillus jeotgali]